MMLKCQPRISTLIILRRFSGGRRVPSVCWTLSRLSTRSVFERTIKVVLRGQPRPNPKNNCLCEDSDAKSVDEAISIERKGLPRFRSQRLGKRLVRGSLFPRFGLLDLAQVNHFTFFPASAK